MSLAKFIDHTILKPDVCKKEIEKVCMEAKEHNFFSVCVNSYYVPFVKGLLDGSEVKVTAVVGFPLGAMDMKSKSYEAKTAIENGANEIDMVINIGALKDRDYSYVLEDIKGVVQAMAGRGILKVIIEACLLTEEEKIKACELSVEAGADFVKTSTGFSTGGAVVEDIQLMRRIVGPDIGVKASGGIRDTETAMKMIEAGANRIGASASVAIVKGVSSDDGGY